MKIKRSYKIIWWVVFVIVVLVFLWTGSTYQYINNNRKEVFQMAILIILLISLCIALLLTYLFPIEKAAQRLAYIGVLTVLLTFFMIALTYSSLMITNDLFSKGDPMHVHGKVIDVYDETRKGNTNHHIILKTDLFPDLLNLTVPRAYGIGEIYEINLKVGKWGIIYSKKGWDYD